MATTYLPDHNALFLHLPKTAGYSITTALAEVPGAQPLPVRGMRRLKGAARYTAGHLGTRIFADTFSFAVIRNPWDWAVSGWKHVTRNTDAYPEDKPDFATFMQGDWTRGLKRNPDERKFASPALFVRYHCFVTQWEHLCTGFGRLVPLAHAVRFERLEEGMAVVERRLGFDLALPHRNRSEPTPWRDYYTDSLREQVAKANAPLIRRFGYRFDQTD